MRWNTRLCHSWAIAPNILLIEDVIGLCAVNTGFAEYTVHPHLPPHIDKLALKIKTVGGAIRTECYQGRSSCTDGFWG